MDKLKFEPEWQDIIDEIEPDTTERVNHTTCTAGEDTRQRVYFTKPAHGDGVLAYCHNCQKGNRFPSSRYRTRPSLLTPIVPTTDEFTVPTSLVEDITDWPRLARVQLTKYSLASMAYEYGVRYDAHTNRLYYPILSSWFCGAGSGDTKGYQLRKLQGSGPKYTTVMRDEDVSMHTILKWAPEEESREVPYSRGVIVEDLLSGLAIIKCAKWRGTDSVEVLVNYGTKVNIEAINEMNDCESICVWLDNDNDHVVHQANTITRTASLITGRPVNVIQSLDDPKKYTSTQIEGALWTA